MKSVNTTRPVPLLFSIIFLLLVVGLTPGTSSAQQCSGEAFHILDFWVGKWEVYSGDQKIGTNRIEKTLEGCAIFEHWKSAKGGHGKSLFYYYPPEKRWKQVWVTANPMRPGGVKEKALVKILDSGSLRFQGTVKTDSGSSYLDRTTLTPLENGNVRQTIEISTDNGKSWQERFRAVYRKTSK